MKATIFKLLFLLCLSFLYCDIQAQEHPRDSIFESDLVKDTTKYIEYLNEAYSDDAKDWWANYRLARYFVAKNDLEKAEPFLDSSIKFNPNCAACLAWKAAFLFDMNQLDSGKRILEAAELISNDDYWVKMFWGQYYTSIGKPELAIINYNKAVDLDKKSSLPHYYAALANLSLSYQVTAIKELDKAIAIDSNIAQYHYERGKTYHGLEIFESAEFDLRKAVELDSLNYSYLLGYGAILHRLGKVEEALKYANKAYKVDSTDYLVYYNRSLNYYSLEKMDEYCQDIRSAIKYLPENRRDEFSKELDYNVKYTCDSTRITYYYQRGIAAYNLQKYEDALSWYYQGLAKFPNHAITLSFVGNALLALQRYPEAILAYKESIERADQIQGEYIASGRVTPGRDANEASIGYLITNYYSIAESYLYSGYLDSSKLFIDKIIPFEYKFNEMSPGMLSALKGRYELFSNNFTLAIKEFNQAYMLSGGHPEYLLYKAIAKINSGINEKVKMVSIGVNNSMMPMNRMVFPLKNIGPNEELKSALTDCNKVIELTPDYYYAYFIRGQLRKIIGDSNYCDDFKVLEQAGVSINLQDYSCY